MFLDSGAGIVSPVFSLSIEQRNKICKANDLGVVWCGEAILNGQTDKSFTCLQMLVNKSLTW